MMQSEININGGAFMSYHPMCILLDFLNVSSSSRKPYITVIKRNISERQNWIGL